MVRKLAGSAFLVPAFLLLVVPTSAFAGEGPGLPTDAVTASCPVFVDVLPIIAVTAGSSENILDPIQQGWFTGHIPFQVHANTQKVEMWAVASVLHKGGIFHVDPPDSMVPPILLAPQSKAGIYPELASPVGGEDNLVAYVGLEPIDGFRAFRTEHVVFESAQNNRFSQLVDLEVTWNQDNPEKPMGLYSGRVKLYAMIVLR